MKEGRIGKKIKWCERSWRMKRKGENSEEKAKE